jgi:hypothetical protein
MRALVFRLNFSDGGGLVISAIIRRKSTNLVS